MKLHTELRNWLLAIIKQRMYLLKNGLSKKNPHQMLSNTDYMLKRLEAFPYATNRKISLFFQQNRDKILSLLPGEGSGGAEKRLEQFSNYDSITKSIINEDSLHHRKNNFPGLGVQGGIRTNGQMGIYA